MADERKAEHFWGNVLECALEFVPDDAGLGILGCIAVAFIVAGIIWAASRLVGIHFRPGLTTPIDQ